VVNKAFQYGFLSSEDFELGWQLLQELVLGLSSYIFFQNKLIIEISLKK
jgi:hypothetical protein